MEVCLDLDGQVWLMLHSGSRNIGKELPERHIGVAKTLAHNAALPDKDLAVSLSGTSGPQVLRVRPGGAGRPEPGHGLLAPGQARRRGRLRTREARPQRE
ncbi:RtcB family protein [Modestobacter marinus]|uniref:RtcB family protein n=1 Tax=Modestobacter marinus TaxID=477641 RepID=UPI0027DFFFA4|nr:RtcB family protein [Modestobacter marinus]